MTIEDLSDTTKPKSDQLNADDLLSGPITITIKSVRRGSNDQPINIDIDGLMPFRPCKSMRRVMVQAWGVNGNDWVGKSLTLFCDPSVKFGGVALGGIRISHMSNLNGPMNMMLTTTRSKRAQYTVNPLIIQDHTEVIKKYMAANQDERNAMWETLENDQQAAINNAFKD